ncbi:hypothetical protein, partial [Faecalibaculum rodentium]|uniref:hypothetical protein n=1 Tax=Faecalibaculum rodentium TaxID=1702221 RepID=UPI0023F5945F
MENMGFFKFSVYRARSVSQRTPEFAVLITAISVSHRLQKKRPAIADLILYMACLLYTSDAADEARS